MRFKYLTFLLFLTALDSRVSHAQTTGTASRTNDNTFASGTTNTFLGVVDMGSAIRTRPAKSGTSLPGTCTVGDQFFKTDATAGSNLYGCTATNTWTAQGGAGGGGTVTSSGTPLIHQVSVWTTSTDAKGIAVGGNNTVLRGAAAADPAFGAIVKADLPATVVHTDQANTWSTGAQDFGSVTSFKIRLAAGLTAATNGFLGYDSTNHMLHAAQNGADAFVPQFTVTPANNDCTKWIVSGSNYKLGSVTCGGSVFSGSTAVTSSHSATPTFSLADVSSKSPTRFEPGALTANVTAVTFTNKTAGAKFSIAWPQDGTGTRIVTYGASASNTCTVDPAPNVTTTQQFEIAADGTTVYGTGCTTTGTAMTSATDCASNASPAVCADAPTGSVAIPTGTDPALVINTTVITANSTVQFTNDSSLGTKLSGITCNTTPLLVTITARTPGVSVTVKAIGTVSTNKLCGGYTVIN